VTGTQGVSTPSASSPDSCFSACARGSNAAFQRSSSGYTCTCFDSGSLSADQSCGTSDTTYYVYQHSLDARASGLARRRLSSRNQVPLPSCPHEGIECPVPGVAGAFEVSNLRTGSLGPEQSASTCEPTPRTVAGVLFLLRTRGTTPAAASSEYEPTTRGCEDDRRDIADGLQLRGPSGREPPRRGLSRWDVRHTSVSSGVASAFRHRRSDGLCSINSRLRQSETYSAKPSSESSRLSWCRAFQRSHFALSRSMWLHCKTRREQDEPLMVLYHGVPVHSLVCRGERTAEHNACYPAMIHMT